MSRLIRTILLAAFLLPTSFLGAQRVTLDVRGAYAMPTSDLDDAQLDAGPGFGATLAVGVMPHLHLYGGWDWLHFSNSGASFAGSDQDFEETGYTFGLRFEHPLGASTTMLRVEGGGTYKHLEVEDADGEALTSTDHGLGFEAGAGMVLPLGSGGWRIAAMLRHRSLGTEFVIGNVATDATLRYAALEVGVSKRF
jgi:hypothetical protein